jgi:DNA repair and recombination protein RAD52
MPPPQRPPSVEPGQQQIQQKPSTGLTNQYGSRISPTNQPPVQQRPGQPNANSVSGPNPKPFAQNGTSYRSESSAQSPTPIRPQSNNIGNPQQPPPQIGFGQKNQPPVSGPSSRPNAQNGSNPQASTAVPNQNPPVGFFTGRAALGQEGNGNIIPETSPSFNPHRPTTIPRSAGVDHNKSSPIARKQLQNTQSHIVPRSNFENPSLTPNRMIGAPPGRGPYRPPGGAIGGIKRPADPYPSANHP